MSDYRRLADAATEGRLDLVALEISKGCDPNKELDDVGYKSYKPPHYWACRYGHFELLKKLVEEYRCNPTYVTRDRGTTLLHVACTKGYLAIAQYLVREHNLNPHVRDVEGASMLYSACCNGHLPVMKYLVAELRCDPRLSHGPEESLLHAACSRGFLDIVMYLINEQGFDPNSTSKFGETPLHSACSNCHLEVVRFLVEKHHCSTSCIDNSGSTPLLVACQNDRSEVVRYLVHEQNCDPTCRDNYGNTPLHVACRYGRVDIAKILLATRRVDPSCTTGRGEAPIHIAQNKEIIKELIRSGANTKGYPIDQKLKIPNSEHEKPLVRVFVVGHPSSGKSTLVKALQANTNKLSNFVKRYRRVTGVAPQTAGIVPTEFESPEFGRVLVFDFAGQYEYYASHAALLECSNTSSAPLIVLVVNLLESEAVIQRRIRYWLAFVESHRVSTSGQPHIVIIGSHKDVLKREMQVTYKAKISAIESFALRQVASSTSLHLIGFFATNCRNPQKHLRIRSCLKDSCEELRANVKADSFCHLLGVLILENFQERLTCTIHEVMEKAQKSDLPIPCTAERLCELAEALSDRMSMLFLKNARHPERSWIVLDIETLLSTIYGRLFAPRNFKEHCFEATNTGIVSSLDIQRNFKDLDLDPSLVIAFLGRLEFCHEVSDPEVLSLISPDSHPPRLAGISRSSDSSSDEERDYVHSQGATSLPSAPPPSDRVPPYHHSHSYPPEQVSPCTPPHVTLSCPSPGSHRHPSNRHFRQASPYETEKFLFFPSLIQSEKPNSGIWMVDEGFTLYTGWCLQCSQQNQFFTPRFLEVLLLRLAFGCAVAKPSTGMPDQNGCIMESFARECTFWKNGLRWLDLDGIEAVVEVFDENRAVAVTMRSKRDSELKCIRLRSAVIRKILEAKEEFCRNVATYECLIEPSQLGRSYPVIRDLSELTLYNVSLIVTAIIGNKTYVHCMRGHKMVNLEELLYFDTYTRLGEGLLSDLYDNQDKKDHALQNFLFEFSRHNADRVYELAQILKVNKSPHHSPSSSLARRGGMPSHPHNGCGLQTENPSCMEVRMLMPLIIGAIVGSNYFSCRLVTHNYTCMFVVVFH